MSELNGVQREFAPNSICFGCGPANEKGLKINSFRIEGGLRTEFETSSEHQAFLESLTEELLELCLIAMEIGLQLLL